MDILKELGIDLGPTICDMKVVVFHPEAKGVKRPLPSKRSDALPSEDSNE